MDVVVSGAAVSSVGASELSGSVESRTRSGPESEDLLPLSELLQLVTPSRSRAIKTYLSRND